LVHWCGIISDCFLAATGVKQGGVLSPVVFCLYVEGLLIALSKADVGCYITNFVGALVYADDIVLRVMLDICHAYANYYLLQGITSLFIQ